MGIRQPRALLAPLGLTTIAVQLRNGLHLKSAVTALPDGRFLPLAQLGASGPVPGGLNHAGPGRKRLPCRPAARDRVLIAASAPRTAQLRDNLGFTPVVADISEFEKLESCLICLSVLPPRR